jgi:hypothetical protein
LHIFICIKPCSIFYHTFTIGKSIQNLLEKSSRKKKRILILSTYQANVLDERVQKEIYIADRHVVNVSKMSSVNSTWSWLDEKPNVDRLFTIFLHLYIFHQSLIVSSWRLSLVRGRTIEKYSLFLSHAVHTVYLHVLFLSLNCSVTVKMSILLFFWQYWRKLNESSSSFLLLFKYICFKLVSGKILSFFLSFCL